MSATISNFAVLIRYDSMYAALIASSVWRAKKHKPLAARAHRAWQLAMEALKGKLWLKHVKGHSGARLNERVDAENLLGEACPGLEATDLEAEIPQLADPSHGHSRL